MPVHTDEAVNALILGDMLEGRPYRYDPVDRHGPTLYYATYPVARLLGAHALKDLEAWQLRLVPAVFGAALLASLLLLKPGVPPAALLLAALWLGAGAPFVYYGRYWIHETLFLLLTFVMLGSVWRSLRTGSRGWSAAAGLSAGALLATKETAVIALACALVALALTRLLVKRPAGPVPGARGNGLLGIAAAVVAAAVLFSSFGRNPGGLSGALGSMAHAAARAGGQGHEKPPFTYLAWLLAPGLRSPPYCGWTMAAFGLAGAWNAWRGRRAEPLPLFLACYAALVLVAYSAIPYKTPWLLINALGPGAVVAGMGLARVCDRCPGGPRGSLSVAIVVSVAVLLASETWRLCFVYPADPGNTLAYAPTSPDMGQLEARVEGLVSRRGAPPQVVAVVGADIWPLPWYLRRCPTVGYWPVLPTSPEATVVLSSADQSEAVSRRLGPGWKSEIYGLRPEVLAILFYRAADGPAPERRQP